jgi:hypothetical protein
MEEYLPADLPGIKALAACRRLVPNRMIDAKHPDSVRIA